MRRAQQREEELRRQLEATKTTRRGELSYRWKVPPDFLGARGKSLKNYLARFNNVIVWVNDPDQIFFVKAFHKGLRASPFSDSLALKRPISMEEIQMRAEKHVEAKEDQAERLEEERSRNGGDDSRTPHRRVTDKPDLQKRPDNKRFTQLTKNRTQILKEICHTRLLHFPSSSEGKILGNNRADWCDFHHTTGHSTKACWTLKTQIERLIQEGQLNQYVRLRDERRGQGFGGQEEERSDGRRRSRSRQGSPVLHRGTITTISGGVFGPPPENYRKREEV
ncbi:hypothetical protein CR513_60965, partial [Mucuna pruriens]